MQALIMKDVEKFGSKPKQPKHNPLTIEYNEIQSTQSLREQSDTISKLQNHQNTLKWRQYAVGFTIAYLICESTQFKLA